MSQRDLDIHEFGEGLVLFGSMAGLYELEGRDLAHGLGNQQFPTF